jgi:predicted SAM-dependent methyltransferase
MNLVVGSGDHKRSSSIYRRPNWINLDIITVPGINVKGDGCHLPFKDNSFEEIHCVHVLEHVTRDKYKPMLVEMHRVLRPGGNLYVETPDFRGTIALLHRAFEHTDTESIHIWTTSIYGKNEREGMAHHWGFYQALMFDEFRALGFKDIERITEKEKMLKASHWQSEPVLLVRGTK